jgi:hypothetical protein
MNWQTIPNFLESYKAQNRSAVTSAGVIADRDAGIQRNAIPAYGKTDEGSTQGSNKPAHVQAGLQTLHCWQTKRQATFAGLTA